MTIQLNQELHLETEACLLVFDPHQHVDWIREILSLEKDQVSHLLLGGDYWDCWSSDIPPRKSAVEMASLLLELANEWAERLTLLWGNHDIAYFEQRPWGLELRKSLVGHYGCSGYSTSKALGIHNILPYWFWKQGRLFQEVNGFLVSHAGVVKDFWPNDSDVDPLVILENECTNALCSLHLNHPILNAGKSRGGSQETSGITWQDFDCEFDDSDIPLPQIVGHTIHRGEAVRKCRSWCLDGDCTCYGILHRNGELEIKQL